jgi:hypothetical protein
MSDDPRPDIRLRGLPLGAAYTPPGSTEPRVVTLHAELQRTALKTGVAWRETESFRDLLCTYVDALREDGTDIVPTILAVKRALAGTPPTMLEQSVKWCIERYFRRPEA